MIKTKAASTVPSFDNGSTSQVSFDLKDFSPSLQGDRLFIEVHPVKLYLNDIARELKDLAFSEHEIDGLLSDFQRKIAVQKFAKDLAERME